MVFIPCPLVLYCFVCRNGKLIHINALIFSSFNSCTIKYYQAKKKNNFVLGNAGNKKNLQQGGLKFTFLTNLIEIFKWSLHSKNYSNNTFLCWKTRSSSFYCSKRKKRQFVQINLLVENHFNSEFYWQNVFDYRLKIQSLTWTLHCRSQHLQPASRF